MKLSKYYSLKKSKSDEIISFIFSFIDAHSKIRREKRQLRNRLFAHEGRLFLSEIREKGPEYDNSIDFFPKTIAMFVFEPLNLSNLSIKKAQAIKVTKILK